MRTFIKWVMILLTLPLWMPVVIVLGVVLLAAMAGLAVMGGFVSIGLILILVHLCGGP